MRIATVYVLILSIINFSAQTERGNWSYFSFIAKEDEQVFFTGQVAAWSPCKLTLTNTNCPARSAKLYHAFRVKPPIGIPLALQREPENPFDSRAIKVMLIQTQGPAQCVGRVPRQLAAILTGAMDQGTIQNVTAFYTGSIISGGPVRGGGPQLSACYLLHLTGNRKELVLQLSSYGFPEDDVFA